MESSKDHEDDGSNVSSASNAATKKGRKSKSNLVSLFLGIILTASVLQLLYFHPTLPSTFDDGQNLSPGGTSNGKHRLDRQEWSASKAKDIAARTRMQIDPASLPVAAANAKNTAANKRMKIDAVSRPEAAASKHTATAKVETTKTELTTGSTTKNQTNLVNNPVLDLLLDAQLISAADVKKHWKALHNPNATTVQINDLTLPTWPVLESLYGSELLNHPRVVGMDTCERYRTQVPPSHRHTAVAGMFNTGTNAMEHHLSKNLVKKEGKVQLKTTWQIPWGKHRMPFVRLKHKAKGLEHFDQTLFLPVVMIRDPFHWMQSMCKMPYAAKWKHNKHHCPNLVPTSDDRKRYGRDVSNGTFPVKVIFDQDQIFHWNSLWDLYTDYYLQYVRADYPRLIVRFEDMLLQPQRVLKQVANCLGVSVTSTWHYQTASSKGHGSHTTFVTAIAKTGDIQRRQQGVTAADLDYARKRWPAELKDLFYYRVPEKEA